MNQLDLLKSNKEIIKSEALDEALDSGQNVDYCLAQIDREEYLWDMRCWSKPMDQHSTTDVIAWLEADCEPNNCGHTIYCVRLLLKVFDIDKTTVALAILKNNKIKYKDEIGTWGNYLNPFKK